MPESIQDPGQRETAGPNGFVTNGNDPNGHLDNGWVNGSSSDIHANISNGNATGRQSNGTSASHIISGSHKEHTKPTEKNHPMLSSNSYKDSHGEPAQGMMPIAIVGMSCRLPGGVSTTDEFWELCSQERTGWMAIPKERFNLEAYHHPNPDKLGCFNATGGNFLTDDLSLWDAAFFNISAQEAATMDPQQRIMLECVWEAVEDAGITKSDLADQNVGCFVGGSYADYELQNLKDSDTAQPYQATGPSATIDTACSSSMSALHIACQSLRNGESTAAIVGGCHLNLLPDHYVIMSLSRLFSDHGKTYTFDDRATSGFGRGEGAGCVVLKPLRSAIDNGDKVHAVIVGSGMNQDGKTAGITQPNGTAQEELIRSVYQKAGLNRNDCGFIEAHGTGTKVGDPIEATALYNVLGKERRDKHPLYVGSVKPNIGHCEGASGVISVIKTAMILDRGFILPNTNYENPNPDIPLKKWNMKVPNSQKLWPQNKRFASVNNFGFGGTNAHCVLAKAPLPEKPPALDGNPLPEWRLIVLSAASEEAVKAQMKNLGVFLEQRPEAFANSVMPNLAYTLCERRSMLAWKVAVPARSAVELTEKLSGKKVVPVRATENPNVGFVFTGQGAQSHQMGHELMKSNPIFADVVKAADQCLKDLGAKFSLVDELAKDQENTSVDNAHISQPACTAIQIALVDLLRSWGISPTAVTGHSSGEIAAAYAAGILSLDDAMTIAYHRGVSAVYLREKYPHIKGAMLAVGAGAGEVEPLFKCLHNGHVSIACINSPSSVTISGDAPAIKELAAILEKKGLFHRQLKIDLAYHSHHMLNIADEYLKAISHIQPRDVSDVAFFSSLKGHQIESLEVTSSYWVSNLTSPVLFSQSLQSLCSASESDVTKKGKVSILCEIGPHSALKGPVGQILKGMSEDASKIKYAPSLVRNKNASEAVLELASILFMSGCKLNFQAVNFPRPHEKKPTLLSSLPTYPWQRTKHWAESRISQNHRMKRFARSDLIGTLANDSNDLEPRWRNILRPDDLPWTRHHKMQDIAIWPMTGYVAMAMEASKQRAIMRGVNFDKFVLREVSISRPLIIQDDATVETMITLRAHAEGTRTTSDTWDEFRVFSWAHGKGWLEHCNGLISLQNTSKSNPIDGERQHREAKSSFAKKIAKMSESCTTAVNSSTMYESLSDSGVQYKGTFQGLENVQACDDHATADLRYPNTAEVMPYQHESDFIVHPATLDLCIQIVWPMFGAGRMGIKQLYLPSFISNLSISCNMGCRKAGEVIRIHGSGSPMLALSKPVHFDLFATDPHDGDEVVFNLEGLILTPVYDKDVQARQKAARDLCYKVQWEPDVELTEPDQLKMMFDAGVPCLEGRRRIQQAEQASFYYLETAFAEVPSHSLEAHHLKFYTWMQRQVELGKANKLRLQTYEWLSTGAIDRKKFLAAFKKSCAFGELICSVGEKLPEILRGDINPLVIMHQDDLLNRYYVDLNSSSRGCEQVSLYLDKLAHQNPHMNILEVRASMGGVAGSLLDVLGGGSSGMAPRFGRYVYTDVSDASLEAAKTTFEAWGGLMEFRKFDPDESSKVDGNLEKTFDVVVAFNTLHCSNSLERAMLNVRQVLKPGGKLILVEQTIPSLSQFVRYILPEWWSSEEKSRLEGTTAKENMLDDLLSKTGFSGLDFTVQDYPDSLEHQATMLVSTAASSPSLQQPNADVVIITHKMPTDFPLSTLAEAIEMLSGKSLIITSLSEVSNTEGKICLFLGELVEPLLKNLDASLFKIIQRVITTASGLLWVSRGAYVDSRNPNANMISGLARTVRSETSLKFVTLDLDQRDAKVPSTKVFRDEQDLEPWKRSRLSKDYSLTSTGSEDAKTILKVFKTTFAAGESKTELDMEYVERNGRVLIPRIIGDKTMDNVVHQDNHESEPFLQSFKQEGRPLRMNIENYGSLDTLYFADDPTADAPLPDDHVEIEVKVSGLNFKDIMIAMGQLPTETVLGVECSGVVTAVGSKVSQVSDLVVGDRVSAMSAGTFGNLTRCKATNACRMPANMTFEVAATIPVIFGTAYYALFDLARLCEGESVLIHAAAGGVGQAAIILSQIIGATIYTTVGSIEKKEFLMKQYGLPDENIFFSRDTSFGAGIKRATDGKGVDVVLNSLAGDFLETTWKCVAPFGRFIEIGKRDIVGNTRLEMQPFEYNATFASVDLTKVGVQRPSLMKRLLDDVFALFRDRNMPPVAPITVFPISDVERAFRLLQGGKTMGKVVVQASPDAQVKTVAPKTPSSLLRADATYIIVGGTGGIGRSITKWMVEKGAQNIVLISRSGNSKQNVKDLIHELGGMGATVVAHKCDVGDKSDVDRMLIHTAKTMPPVRGVVHGAMVLNDVLFEKMTFSNWDEVVRPKVAGAWNLHNGLINEPLDFFIMLSSVAGMVGNRGQAAYSAAGTFLDAFAQYRLSQGLPATSIDLAAVDDIGYLAENLDKQALVASTLGNQVIGESEIMALMASAITGKMASCHDHCITGLQLDAKVQEAFWARDAKFCHLRRALATKKADSTGPNAPPRPIGMAVKEAQSAEEGVRIICAGLVAKVSAVLIIPIDAIDAAHSVASYGLDSLAAIEVRNWITRELEASLQVLELLTSGSILALSELIWRKSKLVANGAAKVEP